MKLPRLHFTRHPARLAAFAAAMAFPWMSAAQQPKAPAETDSPANPSEAASPAPTPVSIPEAGSNPNPSPSQNPGLGSIKLNFQGASLTDVLNYLSEAAGFVIVQEAPVSGTVTVISRQPVTAEEAVDLLNAVLVEKGYVALRNGRILKIISRKDAQKRDLPVEMGSDPAQIPRKDQMVTQILPLHYGEAAKLVENLRPLLSENATIGANESSNAILLTDTQINIRRIAQIIQAIDTSVSSISTVRVYALQFADAKGLANVITQLFANTTTTGDQSRGGRRGGFPFGGFGGSEAAPVTPQSEARQAAARVIAVSDDQSNSVIVSAPEEAIPTITDIIKKIDTNTTEVTNTRIFRLLHADATEMAATINSLYSDSSTQAVQTRNVAQAVGQALRRGQGGAAAPTSQASERALQQARVVAVGDPRTNSLMVNTGRETMTQIAEMVGRLDATDSKRQHVYVHLLQHADPDSVAAVLRGMLGDSSGASTTQTETSRLMQRTSSGASTDATQTSSNSGRSAP